MSDERRRRSLRSGRTARTQRGTTRRGSSYVEDQNEEQYTVYQNGDRKPRKKGSKKSTSRRMRSMPKNHKSSYRMRNKQPLVTWGNGLYDHSLLFLVLFLVVFGLIMIYSTSYYSATMKFNNSMYYLKRQGIMVIAGIVVMLCMSKFNYKIFLKKIPQFQISWATFTLLVSIVLQVYVLVNGKEFNGAKRWIEIGPLGTFQPSDFAKVAVILFVSYQIYQNPRILDTFRGFVQVVVLAMVDIALIAVENVSTAIILTIIVGGTCFVASRRKEYYLIIGVLGAVGLAGILMFGEGFRMKRFQIWLHLEDNPADDYAYQILQGLYAVASGGLFGKGLGKGVQKLGYVPEAQNDWIFSIICEELGMFGACCVLCVFIFLLWRIFQIAINAPDLFGGMICTGIMIHIAAQVAINVAVVTNSIPSTGVALPFISYGGTSVALMLIEMGLVLSVSNQIKLKQKQEEALQS